MIVSEFQITYFQQIHPPQKKSYTKILTLFLYERYIDVHQIQILSFKDHFKTTTKIQSFASHVQKFIQAKLNEKMI